MVAQISVIVHILYLISCLVLYFTIIIGILVGAPGYVKCVVKTDVLVSNVKIRNPELICYGPNFPNFMQVHENEDDQAINVSEKY